MSDETKSPEEEPEVEAHGPRGPRGEGPRDEEGPRGELTEDDEPDVEAHGPRSLGPRTMGPKQEGPRSA
jgi:hypothetical protein